MPLLLAGSYVHWSFCYSRPATLAKNAFDLLSQPPPDTTNKYIPSTYIHWYDQQTACCTIGVPPIIIWPESQLTIHIFKEFEEDQSSSCLWLKLQNKKVNSDLKISGSYWQWVLTIDSDRTRKIRPVLPKFKVSLTVLCGWNQRNYNSIQD